MKMYQYTVLKQDGSIKTLIPCKRKSLEELYELLSCSTIEIVDPAYYAGKGYGRCTMYGDEEARLNGGNRRNPHFNVLGSGWDIVGDVVRELAL